MLLGLLAVGLCALLWMETTHWRGGILRLPFPIALGRGLPVPLFYWIGVLLYSWASSDLLGLPRQSQRTRALWLGFGLHAMALIAALPWWFATPGAEFPGLTVWYVRYWQAVWVLAVAFGGVGLWAVMSARRRSWATDPLLFFLPWVGGYLALWLSASTMPTAIALVAAGLTIGFVIAWHVDTIRLGGTHLLEWLSRERIFVAVILLMALAFRLFYMTRILSSPDFLNTGSDGPAYDALAWAVVHGGETQWSHMPMFAAGYVRFLAAIYWLVGRNYVIVCAVQSLLGALACLLLYAVVKRLFDVAVARVAAVFAALNFLMIFSAAAIGHQAVDLFWTLLVVWCLVGYLDDPQRWGRWIVGIGLLLGWAVVTREVNVFVWMFLLGWFAFGVRRRVGWPRALCHALLLSVGVLVVLLPFIWGTGGGLKGRVAYHWFYSSPDFRLWFNPWLDPAAAWTLLREQPLEVAGRMTRAILHAVVIIFFNQEYGAFDPIFLVRGSPYYLGMWTYAYAAAFYGLALMFWDAWRAPRERLGWWLILGVLASRALPHIFLEGNYRHRTPIEPYLIVLMAVGLVSALTNRHASDARPS